MHWKAWECWAGLGDGNKTDGGITWCWKNKGGWRVVRGRETEVLLDRWESNVGRSEE